MSNLTTRTQRIAKAREIHGQWSDGTARARCQHFNISAEEIAQGFVLGAIDLRVLRALNGEYGRREYGGWNEGTLYRQRELEARWMLEAVQTGALEADSLHGLAGKVAA